VNPGTYYVDGIRLDNPLALPYTAQPDYPLTDQAALAKSLSYLIYLDVWERHITYVEDDSVREVALGGVDTCSRAQLTWQVKALSLAGPDADDLANRDKFEKMVWDKLASSIQPRLRARAKRDAKSEDPCTISPDARYRGENQLYRVEVHHPGNPETATFKWSRENGSVILPIEHLAGQVVTLETLGRDEKLGLDAGDWVEIVDDDYTLQNRAEPLVQIDTVDGLNRRVTLREAPQSNTGADAKKHPYLRRWDQKPGDPAKGGLEITSDGAAHVREGFGETGWLFLEKGVQIQFVRHEGGQPAVYKTGDYWMIPARTATGDVEWPGAPDAPQALAPFGIEHHYAPLATITLDGNSLIVADNSMRRKIPPGAV
jgi:hypothetical protein